MALAVIIIGLAVFFGIHTLAAHYLDKPSTQNVARCMKKGPEHMVIMHDGAATPNYVRAKLCDTLTIENTDAQIRLVAFGEHENHQAYDGVLEKVLQKNQSITVTLNKAGTYKFHDHLEDSAQGTFTIN